MVFQMNYNEMKECWRVPKTSCGKGCDHMFNAQSASVGWNPGFCNDAHAVNRTAMGQEQTAKTWKTRLTSLLFLQQKFRNGV